ncbi:hypothetical protein Droror1_Dr00022940 [Drosera rotundifolia]
MEHRSSQPLVVKNARHDLRWGFSSWAAASYFSSWPATIDLVKRATEVTTVSGINWEGSGAVVSSPGRWRRCRRCLGKATTLFPAALLLPLPLLQPSHRAFSQSSRTQCPAEPPAFNSPPRILLPSPSFSLLSAPQIPHRAFPFNSPSSGRARVLLASWA